MAANKISSSSALWSWIGAALVLDLAGAQHVYTLATVTAAMVALLAVVLLLPASLWRSSVWSQGEPALLMRLLPLLAFIAAMVDVATFVPPDGGWTSMRLMLLSIGICLFLVLIRVDVVWSVIAALGLGIAIRIIHMRHIPIMPENGDMLPLVQSALKNLLEGQSPYTMYNMPWELPLTYLPVTWLAYLPTYLLDVDLRWTNIAAEVGILAALVFLSVQSAGWRSTLRQQPALLLWAWLFLQPSVIHWDMGNTAPITWLLLAALFAFVLAERNLVAAGVLGLTAAGTPLVVVFGTFMGIYWLRQLGTTRTIRLASISAIIAGVLIIPFLVWAPGDFLMGTYRWFNTIDGWPRQKWAETDPHIWSVITGFSGEFWSRGRETWLKPIQTVIVLGIAGLYWLRGAKLDDLPIHAAAAYLGFMLFNPVLWPYLYNPALIVGLVGVTALTAKELIPVRTSLVSSPVQPTLKSHEAI